MKTFRFDDVCTNSNMLEVELITDFLLSTYDCKIIWAVSPLVHKSESFSQRVFPKIFTAHSDYRKFYSVDSLGLVPNVPKGVVLASHGLIHVDHRLLDYYAQEMSILVSCSLVGAKMFVPPFNKWNKDTEKICKDNGIELVKFEDGWLSMEHNPNIEGHKLWYLHHWNFNFDKVKEWVRL